MSLRLFNPSALHLIALGDFASAEAALGSRWRGPGVLPLRDGDGDYEYAELLMFCGILTVEYALMGSALQERGKDMLTKSVRLYGDNEESQLAKAWLAIAYERSGEFNEAMVVAESVLAENPNLEVAVCAAKTKAICQTGSGSPEAALVTLSEIAPLIPAAPPSVQGKYYLQRGGRSS